MVAGKFGPYSDLVQAFLNEVARIDRSVWHRVAELTDVTSGNYVPTVVGFGFNAAIHSALDSAATRAYRQLKLGPNEFPEEAEKTAGAIKYNIAGALARVVFTIARWDEVLPESRREVMMPFVKVGFTTLIPLVAEERPNDDVTVYGSYRQHHPLGWRRYGPHGQTIEAYIQEIATISHDDMRRLRGVVNANLVGRRVLMDADTRSLPLWKGRAVDADIVTKFDELGIQFDDEHDENFTRSRVRNGARVLAVSGSLEPGVRRVALEPFAGLGMVSVLSTMVDETSAVDPNYPQNVGLTEAFWKQVARISHEGWHRLFEATAPSDGLMAAQDAVEFPLLDRGRRGQVYAETASALRKVKREECCEAIWPRIAARTQLAALLLAVHQYVPIKDRHVVLDPFAAVGFTTVAPVLA